MAKKGVYFDGVHCRDSDGKFVPVPQCTGRRKIPKGATGTLGQAYPKEDVKRAMSFPVTKQRLAKRIENYMDAYAARASRRAGSFPPAEKSRLLGMEQMAWRLGVSCSCYPSRAKGRHVCTCSVKTASEERMR